MADPTPPPAPRKRRTAEAARSAILDAAERRLIEAGPAGIRLQDVAADVGVSHPTVLHHFGSREGLVQAVVARAHQSIYARVIEAIEQTEMGEGAMAQLLDRIFEVIAAQGHARVMFWLALHGVQPLDERTPLRAVLATTHALRQRQQGDGAAPSMDDTRFAVMLAMLALTAQSVLGPQLFDSLGVGERDSEQFQLRFRAWLAKLLTQHFGLG